MAKSGKATKQVIVDAIAKQIESGKERGKVLAIFVKKWQISARTFDRYWKTANEQHKKLQDLAKEAADKAYIHTAEIIAVEALMSQVEAQKLTTDIARGNLADYMIIKKVEHIPRIEIPLSRYIVMLNDEIRFEEDFSAVANLVGEELLTHITNQARRKRDVLRAELELKKNKHATRIVNGPVEWKEVTELDMVKLIADKEKGKIKSIAHTQFGIKVEMYGADSALVNILKMHGAFQKDNEQQKPELSSHISDSQFEQLLKAAREAKAGTSQ